MNKKRWGLSPADNDPSNAVFTRTYDEYLPPDTKVRWVRSRKTAVVNAIRDGFMTSAEAQALYHLSAEELADWQAPFDATENCGPRPCALAPPHSPAIGDQKIP